MASFRRIFCIQAIWQIFLVKGQMKSFRRGFLDSSDLTIFFRQMRSFTSVKRFDNFFRQMTKSLFFGGNQAIWQIISTFTIYVMDFRDHGITKIASVAWTVLAFWTAWPTMMVPMANFTVTSATLESLARRFVQLMWITKSVTHPWSNPKIQPRIVPGVEVPFSRLKRYLAKTDFIIRNAPVVLLVKSHWRTTQSSVVNTLPYFSAFYGF